MKEPPYTPTEACKTVYEGKTKQPTSTGMQYPPNTNQTPPKPDQNRFY